MREPRRISLWLAVLDAEWFDPVRGRPLPPLLRGNHFEVISLAHA